MKKLSTLQLMTIATVFLLGWATNGEGGAEMGRHVTREVGKVWLDGLHRHEVRINQLGNLLASAHYLGYEGSDAWLSGATAFAFALMFWGPTTVTYW